jgi:hypothetical protein
VCTDSWSSIVGAGCGLICIGAGEETSRLSSMDPVAERDQVQAVWWEEKQDEVGTVS